MCIMTLHLHVEGYTAVSDLFLNTTGMIVEFELMEGECI